MALTFLSYYIGAVYLFFLNTNKKNRCDSYKNVGHVFCQIFQLWRFRLVCLRQLIVLVLPDKQDFNNSVQFNAFALKAATDVVIVEIPVMI